MIKFSSTITNYNGYTTLLGKLGLEDLVRDTDFSFIKCPRRTYKAQTKKALAIKVFLSFMKIVVTDIIKNGSVFKLPSYKRAYLFVGDDWSDRESKSKNSNIFSFENEKVLQIAINNKNRTQSYLGIVQRDIYKDMNNNKHRYKLDPTYSL